MTRQATSTQVPRTAEPRTVEEPMGGGIFRNSKAKAWNPKFKRWAEPEDLVVGRSMALSFSQQMKTLKPWMI
ncbi:hypothetical protein GQ457_01G045220 [Hibiscus cannabinus]